MWELVSKQKIYYMINNKHCSICYDVYIQGWLCVIVDFNNPNGIGMYSGISKTLSNAMLLVQRRCSND
jgi:hypothetical protein